MTFDLFPGTAPQLKEALAIRHEVFVLEQNVPIELEIDDHDGIAWHILAYEGDQPVATARLVTLDADRVKIGRVSTLEAYRHRGIATGLVRLLLEYAQREGFSEAILDSQLPVLPLYEKLGFVPQGEVFLDADILHRRMSRKLVSN